MGITHCVWPLVGVCILYLRMHCILLRTRNWFLDCRDDWASRPSLTSSTTITNRTASPVAHRMPICPFQLGAFNIPAPSIPSNRVELVRFFFQIISLKYISNTERYWPTGSQRLFFRQWMNDSNIRESGERGRWRKHQQQQQWMRWNAMCVMAAATIFVEIKQTIDVYLSFSLSPYLSIALFIPLHTYTYMTHMNEVQTSNGRCIFIYHIDRYVLFYSSIYLSPWCVCVWFSRIQWRQIYWMPHFIIFLVLLCIVCRPQKCCELFDFGISHFIPFVLLWLDPIEDNSAANVSPFICRIFQSHLFETLVRYLWMHQ